MTYKVKGVNIYKVENILWSAKSFSPSISLCPILTRQVPGCLLPCQMTYNSGLFLEYSLRWQSQYFSSTCALTSTICVIRLVVTACVPFSFCWITFLPSVNFFLRPVGVPRVPYQDAVGSPAVGFSKEGGNTVVLFPQPLSPLPHNCSSC